MRHLRRARRYAIVLAIAMLAALVTAGTATGSEVLRERDVAIPAGDHDIPGTLTIPNDRSLAPFPAVLMLHGFGSQKDEVGDMYARVAEDLAERGVASLRIDFAGAGDSQQPWVENTYDGMVSDGLVALDYLVGIDRIDDDRVGLLGFSLGTKVAMSVAATDPRVQAFASWSGVTANGGQGFEDYFDNYYDEALANGSVVVDLGFTIVELSIEWFDTMAASQNLDLIANYHNPLMAIAGTDDTSVDPISSKVLVREAGSYDTTLKLIRGADHIYHVLTDDQSFAERVMRITADWFDSRL